ncbi:MAG: hypothetical protein IJ047_00910 [Paludibacteraceae bacterium]|nr:hypothetical protein [Paludibacteraceae bacterium]
MVLLLTIGVGNVWGAEGDVIKEFNCNVSTANTYARYTPTCDGITWNVSWGQTSYIGTNKSDNYGNLKITNSTDLNAGKAVNASIATTTQGYCAIIPQSTMANVGKITISCSDLKGSPAVYVVSSTSLSTAYTQITLKTGSGLAAQGATMTTSGLTFEFDKKTSGTYYAIVFYSANWYRLNNTDLQFIEGATAGCSNAVALSKGTATNGTVNTISSASVATCSATASDRRVTVTITPAACYDAPTNLSWTKSSGTVSVSKQSGPTDNGDGTYSYVYQFAQNDNGAGTFGVTCTAKAAGKTVNFNAGPGSCGTSSLTETCDGSGVTLPNVTASGVCKGWTTFAGWATAAVNDSNTTSVTVYAADSKFVPASNGQTLYAVYSKTKGGGGSASWVLSSSAPAVGDSIIVAYYTGSAYKYMKNSGADNGDLTVAAGVATPVANGKFKLVSGDSYGVSLQNSSNYLHLNSSAINVTTERTNGDINISSGSSSNSFIIKRHNGSTTYDRVLTWSGTNWATSSTMNSGCEVYFFKRTTSTTYYCSDPNCCTPLGQINGSFYWT